MIRWGESLEPIWLPMRKVKQISYFWSEIYAFLNLTVLFRSFHYILLNGLKRNESTSDIQDFMIFGTGPDLTLSPSESGHFDVELVYLTILIRSIIKPRW
jgi:hypothetical protein